MSRSLLSALAAAAALLTLAAPTAAPARSPDGPAAAASKTCKVGNSRGYGTTYVRWIRATHTSCKRAKRVIRAFHACRKGARGKCGHVGGWSCSENRNFGRGSFDSTATCRNGGKVVKHGYTQWT